MFRISGRKDPDIKVNDRYNHRHNGVRNKYEKVYSHSMFYPLPVKKEEQKPEDTGRLVNDIDHLINFRKPEYDQSSAIVPCIYSCLYCGVTGNIPYYTNDCFNLSGIRRKRTQNKSLSRTICLSIQVSQNQKSRVWGIFQKGIYPIFDDESSLFPFPFAFSFSTRHRREMTNKKMKRIPEKGILSL